MSDYYNSEEESAFKTWQHLEDSKPMGLTFEERQAHRCRCRKAEEAYCAIAEANLHLKLARQQAAFEAEEERKEREKNGVTTCCGQDPYICTCRYEEDDTFVF